MKIVVTVKQKLALKTASQLLKKYWNQTLPVPVKEIISKENIDIVYVKDTPVYGKWHSNSESIILPPNMNPKEEKKSLVRCLGQACLVQDINVFIMALLLPIEPFIDTVVNKKISLDSAAEIFDCSPDICKRWVKTLKEFKVIAKNAENF